MNKTARAIRTLRNLGMSNEQIEAELGFSLNDIMGAVNGEGNDKPLNGETLSHGIYGEIDSEGIIDVEVVEVETSNVENDAVKAGTSLEPMVIDKQRRHSRWPRWSEEWWANVSPQTQSKRCKATNTKGERCQRLSISGAAVCYVHGGAAPQIKRAARIRLENAADRMARNLLGIADDAESENVRLAATNSALDRAGLKPPEQVVLSAGTQAPWEEIFEDIATTTREDSRRARGYEEPPQKLAEEVLGSSVEFIGPQHVSSTENAPTPASASGSQHTDEHVSFDMRREPGTATSEGGSDPLAAAQSDQDQRLAPSYRTRVVEGYDALRLANLANLNTRQLPPGRGR